MTNIEKLLTDAGASVESKGATVDSRGPRYVNYGIGGVYVIVRPGKKTWTAYETFEAVSSDDPEGKARETLSAIQERAGRLETLVVAMRGLKDPWGEAEEEA